MCGIAGIISPQASLIRQDRLQAMADALIHRGPDGEGFWINPSQTLGFAHRRLAVIDLSAQAAQPLHYLHYTVIFNGEIYNYRELKAELATRGYIFRTASDTEVIPAAYDCWGMECLDHFDGMFAFAIWDEKNGEVKIARDRYGEKPLYYYAVYPGRGRFETFLFASEMKALWKAGVPRKLNGTSFLNYLALGYTQHPEKKTETFYTGILSLPPGHFLTIRPGEGRVQLKKWYHPRTPGIFPESDKPVVENFRGLFFSAVQKRLQSEKAVGTSLSGGLDSSSVLAAIREAGKAHLAGTQWENVAFSAVFPGFSNDESPYSKRVAADLGVTQYCISPTADDWVKHFNRLMYHQEEPVQSSSVLVQYLVYQLAKEKNITVILDGQGADEILAGYKKYTPWYLQELFVRDRVLFREEKKLLRQNEFLPDWGWQNYAAALFPQKTAEILQQKAVRQILRNRELTRSFREAYLNKDILYRPVIRTLEDLLHNQVFGMGLEELLRYADRNSMAHSREVRLPFLSHQLVEYIQTLPPSFKIRNGFTKWILRESIQDYLPDTITWRKNKIGFEPPQKNWMADTSIQEMIHEARKKLVTEKVLDKKVLDSRIRALPAHESGNRDWRYLCAASIF